MGIIGRLAVVCLLFALGGCGGSDGGTGSASLPATGFTPTPVHTSTLSPTTSPTPTLGVPADGPWTAGAVLPAEPQFQGDPVRGRDILLNGAYMSCGLPYKLWANPLLRGYLDGGFGLPAHAPTIPGRTGHNADMPYYLMAFTTREGVEVFNANCLTCHGGTFDGQLIIGLGNGAVDFTDGVGGGAPSTGIPDNVLDLVGLDAGEKREFNKLLGRFRVAGPATAMRTVGLNPAEQLALALMQHHDRDTLAWSDAELFPWPVIKDAAGNVIQDARVTSDPPPWWRVHKKNALFYNGMARGDHRGTMEYATSVCVDDIDQAYQVDEWFKDIQAFINTIHAPHYTRAIDRTLAAQGHALFMQNCAGCHGTYADDPDDDAHDTYPNLLIPIDLIGTDPAVAAAGVFYAPQLVDWYNSTFYGQVTPLRPADPFPGYMPPPLDGIWATAPYLHNGSVPTVDLVLNSHARPAVWKRVDYDTTHFDEDAMGWPWVAVPYAQADAPPNEQRFIYDTSYVSQSNSGHTFGDHLSDAERRAVIEYLKTL